MEIYTLADWVLGIDRTRSLAPPKDGALYDAVNVDLTPGHTLKRRSGFASAQALTGGVGLTSFQGYLHTFFSGADPGATALCKTHKLVCPDGSGSALSKIYFAAPLLGYLYVVAEFANGTIWHFYLDDGASDFPLWLANTQHSYGDIVCPNAYNGLRYYNTTYLNPSPWSAKLAVTVNSTEVTPSKPNGYIYKCTAISVPAGANAATGTTEPTWPTAVNDTVVEDVVDSITKNKTWGAGLYVAAGEQMLPTALVGTGLHVVAGFNPEGARNVNYTGAYEPIWPKTAGDTVTDGTITWTVVEHVLITWTCLAGNVTGATEPVWSTTIGSTVVDGGITWECISNKVWDTSCPNTASAVIASSRVLAQGPASEPDIVNYSSVANPRAWNTTDTPWAANTHVNVGDEMVDANGNVQRYHQSGVTGAAQPVWARIPGLSTTDGSAKAYVVGVSAPDDAGFIAAGLQALSGDTSVTGLGLYRGNLAVGTSSGFQVWQLDPDPTQIMLLDQFDGRGWTAVRGAVSTGSDMYFASPQGVRSLSTVAQTVNMEAGDIGAFIDDLVQPLMAAADNFTPLGNYLPALGRFILHIGNQAFVLHYLPIFQVEGWTRYTLPWNVLYSATLNGTYYVLANDGNLYSLSSTQWQDDTAGAPVVYTTQLVWPNMVLGRHTMFQPMGTAGYTKMMRGIAVVANDSMTLQCAYSDGYAGGMTPAQTVGPDDRAVGMNPLELLCTSLAPQISYATNFAFEFSALQFFYDILGQMVA